MVPFLGKTDKADLVPWWHQNGSPLMPGKRREMRIVNWMLDCMTF
jgi:hypothetical protein